MTEKEFALGLAKRAGEIIRSNFMFGMEKQIKPDGSPVTKTDLAINSMVIEEVKKHFPTHAVVGEEESYAVEGYEYAWVCDPVDGTIPFSRGMPTCAFSLGLTHNGVPILGVAYDPFMDRMFAAELGKGAFVNETKIHVSEKSEIEKSFVSVDIWSSMKYRLPGIADDLIFKLGAENFGMASIVYNAVLLAAGELDGVVFAHHTAHDVAAVKVIVEEAGGKVTDLFGNDQRYDEEIKGCILSNGKIHDELVALVKIHLKV